MIFNYSYVIGTCCNTQDFILVVYIAGNCVYMAYYYSGFQMIDISIPDYPFIIDSCNTPDHTIGIYISGDFAYVAVGSSGLQVIGKYKPLNDITYLDSYIFIANVSADYNPGTYKMHITNPDGERTMLHNAFTVYK